MEAVYVGPKSSDIQDALVEFQVKSQRRLGHANTLYMPHIDSIRYG